jgi:nucleotide-binding universal stress UspA family protein
MKTRHENEIRLGHVRRILAGFDGSEDSRRALLHAKRLARQHHARLAVIQVVPPITCHADYGYGPVTRHLEDLEAEKKAKRELNRIVGGRPAARRPEVLVKSGCAWQQILRAAEKLQSDVIVVGGSEHDLPESTICAGTGAATASKARCPTLIVKRDGVELKPGVT